MMRLRKTRKTNPSTRRPLRLQLEHLEERCLLSSGTVIESFDGSNLANWTTVLRNLPAADTGFSSVAAHDGSAGLRKTDGYEWLVRNDAAAQVGQGQTLSVWVRFAGVADGRAYLGFGATPNDQASSLASGRTYSLVLAANNSSGVGADQLILQINSGFGHTNVAAIDLPSEIQANTWYRLEVTWGIGSLGTTTGRLFGSDGVTQIGSDVTAVGLNAWQAGGVALRSFSPSRGEVYFDTITVSGTTTFTSPFVGRTLIPAQTLSSNFYGANSPFLYQSTPGTNLDVGLSAFNNLAQVGGSLITVNGVQTVGLAGQNESVVFGVQGVQHQNGWGPPINGLSGSGVPVETPLLQQYIFRLRPGETTQLIGTSDVKHFFSSAHTDFQHLRPGEKDVYGTGLNSALSLFSPREEINPFTGQLQSLDFLSALRTTGNGGPRNLDGINTNQSSTQAYTPQLLRVNVDDLNPATNPVGTRWFLAGHLWIVGDQDVTNNTRWVEFTPSFNGTTFSFTYPNGSNGQLDVRSIPGLANYARIIDDRNDGSNAIFGGGFSATAGFISFNGQGYGLGASGIGEGGQPNRLRYAEATPTPGTATATATWTFSGLAAGTYRVYTTYTADPNRATNAPYRINGGSAILVNQEVAPSDLSYAGTTWRLLSTSATPVGGTITVTLTNDANEYVIADGVLIERVTTATTTQIIDDGDAGFTTTAGWVSATGQGFGSDVRFAFTGSGSEYAQWTFLNVTPGLYRISATWSADPNRSTNAEYLIFDGQPTVYANNGQLTGNTRIGRALVNQEIAPNHFSASGVGWHNLGGVYAITSGTIVVRLTDSGNEYSIADAIRIERLTTDTTQIRDNSSATGYDQTAGFTQFVGTGSTSQGYYNRGGVSFAAPGTGSENATWTFAVTPGTYRVSVTWSVDANRATDAKYTVYNGAPTAPNSLGTTTLSQEVIPGDYVFQGTTWRDLVPTAGGTGFGFVITGTTLTVRLTDLANDYVIADAVRIERLS